MEILVVKKKRAHVSTHEHASIIHALKPHVALHAASIESPNSASDEISLHLAESAYQMTCIEGEEEETDREQLQKSRHQMLTSKEGAGFVSDRGESGNLRLSPRRPANLSRSLSLKRFSL